MTKEIRLNRAKMRGKWKVNEGGKDRELTDDEIDELVKSHLPNGSVIVYYEVSEDTGKVNDGNETR